MAKMEMLLMFVFGVVTPVVALTYRAWRAGVPFWDED